MESKNRLLLIFILITLVSIPQASIGLYIPSLPYMIKALNTNSSELQLTLSIYMIGYALSTLVCGILSDRYGRKIVIVTGLVTYLFATLLCLTANNVDMLIIGRFLQALGGCCGTVVARVIVKDVFDNKEQVRILTYLSTAIAVTPAIAPIIGGYLETYFGWRSGFLVLCLIALMALILSTFGLKETNKNPDPNATNIITILNNYRYLLTQRLFLAYSVSIGLAWCAYYSFIQSSSFVFQSVFKVTPTVYGAMYAIIIIGYIIGTTFTRRYSNKIGIDNVIMYESLVALGSSILMLTLTYFKLGLILSILVPMTILMMGVGGIFPACQAAVMRPFTHIAGTASGLFFFIQMIFGAICGLILSSFHIHSQVPMVLTIVVSCLLLSLSSYLLLPKNRNIITSKGYSSDSGSRNL
ncbi:multidrug effflux MFS transporter [Metabacillus sediminilitoris]|uniref:Bcr/CflA family efflux transporter n=1 Tax=Metabacillus sediminilitoris TaxID=2567941 RepID=A0A4S4BQV6_9BACI|nr:multidrug effflux MFS transporter [Metabacillus sediminilitoris]QGQ45693.1 Bcr/CflA family efflux MFS transporter [Metabacillus sediminilitoris]THF77188.1 multidrug effflux MFS transporter [Metabacillus sediminilitoris]